MVRRHGRCRRGERLRSGVPHGHWKTTTLLAGLRRTGIVAPTVLDGPIDRDAFIDYIPEVLVPDLLPGDNVMMDNLSSDKAPAARAAIDEVSPSFPSSCPTAPTLIRPSKPSPSLKPTCAKPKNSPSMACKTPSAASSTFTCHRNASTI